MEGDNCTVGCDSAIKILAVLLLVSETVGLIKKWKGHPSKFNWVFQLIGVRYNLKRPRCPNSGC